MSRHSIQCLSLLFFSDQYEIADIHDKARSLADHKNGVFLIQCIDKQDQASGKT